VKSLVAKTDGVPGSDGLAFAPGSIQPAERVPVRANFDGPVLGYARITVEGDNVIAEFDGDVLARLDGLYPAVGGRGVVYDGPISDDVQRITRFDLLEVSVCVSPNADPRIAAINLKGGQS
jgi:hypothetical protein